VKIAIKVINSSGLRGIHDFGIFKSMKKETICPRCEARKKKHREEMRAWRKKKLKPQK